MFSQHYSSSFDALSKLESTILDLTQARDFFNFVADKAAAGENVEESLCSAIGFFDYIIERLDKDFPETWNAVITEHPDRFQTDD